MKQATLKKIEITIDSQGNSQVETKGFTGNECLSASRFVEEAMGRKLSLKKTSEYFQTEENVIQNRQSN